MPVRMGRHGVMIDRREGVGRVWHLRLSMHDQMRDNAISWQLRFAVSSAALIEHFNWPARISAREALTSYW